MPSRASSRQVESSIPKKLSYFLSFLFFFLYSAADFFSSSNASENFFETMPGLPRNISRFVKSFRKVVSSGRCRFTPNFERRSNSSSRLRFNLPLGNSSFARSKRFSIPFTSSSRRCTKPALVLSTLWFHSFFAVLPVFFGNRQNYIQTPLHLFQFVLRLLHPNQHIAQIQGPP